MVNCFSAINVYSILGGRSTSTPQSLRWILPKVFGVVLNLPLQFVLELFNI